MPEKLDISHHMPILDRPNANNFEGNRIRSFADWGAKYPVSPIELAKDGFYATQNGDEVKCYSCDMTHSGWTPDEKPHKIHQQKSPNCLMVNNQVTNPDVRPNVPLFKATVPAILTSSSKMFFRLIRKHPIEETDFHNKVPLSFPGVRMRRVRLIPRGPGNFLPFTARVETERQQEPLYGQFSLSVRRARSFTNFPVTRPKLMEELIRHGFFYVGHDDIVLCFFCGLALNCWKEGDDPRIAHVRWSESCCHLHSVEGEDFIRHTKRELEVIGSAI